MILPGAQAYSGFKLPDSTALHSPGTYTQIPSPHPGVHPREKYCSEESQRGGKSIHLKDGARGVL